MGVFVEAPFWAMTQPYVRQHIGLSLYAAPTTEPLTAAEVKQQCRLDTSSGEPSPTALTVALAGAGAGNVENGAHRYLATFVTADGETEAGLVSSAATVADKTVNGKVALSNIPIGGLGVTARRLYRTVAGGAMYLLLATLADNTTTTYVDNIADASLGAQAPVTNTTSDPLLVRFLKAAREFCEAYTDRAFITQTWRQTFTYPPALPFALRKAPLQTVSGITYIDGDGVTQTWATSEYVVDAPAGAYASEGRILSAFGQTVFPVTSPLVQNGFRVEYVAGYGAASAVPAAIKHAIAMLTAHWFRNREAVAIGHIVDTMPLGVVSLLDQFSPAVLA